MSSDRISAHLDALGSSQDQPTGPAERDTDEATRSNILALQTNPTLLENLGKQLDERYEETQDIEDLNLAIEYSRLATKMTASDHPDYTTRLDFLAGLFETRFKSKGFWPDIVNAVQLTHAAVIATNHNDDEIVCRWSNLGERLGRLFGSGGTIADLDNGIRYLSQAVEVTKDPISLFDRLIELAFCLELRFDELAEIEDLDKAISLRRRALEPTVDEDELRLDCQRDLAKDLEARYKSIGQLPDLENAIDLARIVIKKMDIIGPDYYLVRDSFYELGTKLGLLYEKTNMISHLDEAIVCSHMGVGATEGPKEVYRRLEHLWTLRYKKTHQINDSEQAARWAEEAARWERAV